MMSKYLRAHGKPQIERVLIPSVSIIYPPYSEYLEKGIFLCFLPFQLDKIKVSGDSCLTRHFANTKAKRKPAFLKKQSQFWPPHHRTGDSAGDLISGVYLRISSSYLLLLFVLVAFLLRVLFGSYYRS